MVALLQIITGLPVFLWKKPLKPSSKHLLYLDLCPVRELQLEPGFEKIALYADNSGKPTHAARQLDNGRWTIEPVK